MLLSIYSLSENQSVLSGANSGRRLFAALLSSAPSPARPDAAFLDFTGVEVATSSFLRESVVAFRDYARATLPNLYPVLANPAPAVREELEFFLRQRRDAMWSCQLGKDDIPQSPELLGELDDAHRATFDLVRDLGIASAPDLARSDASIGSTAWNNRLSQLAGRGLLIERRTGKTKTFTPVLETS